MDPLAPLLNRGSVRAPRLRWRADASISRLAWDCERTLSKGLAAEPESLPGAKALMSMQALLGGLRELLDCNADLLCQRALDEDLLRKLFQRLDNLMRQVGCAGGGEERIVCKGTRRELILQVWIHLVVQIRILCERILLERVLLSGKGILLGAKRILLSVTAVRAGLSKQAWSRLRHPRRRQTGKLRHESLLGVL